MKLSKVCSSSHYKSVIWLSYLRTHVEHQEIIQNTYQVVTNYFSPHHTEDKEMMLLNFSNQEVIYTKLSHTHTHCTICTDRHMFESSLDIHRKTHNKRYKSPLHKEHFLIKRVKSTSNQLTQTTIIRKNLYLRKKQHYSVVSI